MTTRAQDIARMVLGAFVAYAGVSHLLWSREAFLAQVPDWVPIDADLVVILSGIVEIGLGIALITVAKYRIELGWCAALFFVAVFPGNISQFVDGDPAFGLDSDLARGIRLLFQPVLVVWALWSTGAWAAWRRRRNGTPATAQRPFR